MGQKTIPYQVNDRKLNASLFLPFVDQIWSGDYDASQTEEALSKTWNITAYDNDVLVGCLRILTDGYFFGTITELLVLPEYRNQGIGSRLLSLARDNTPTMLYFGAQPGAEAFYEKNGCRKSLPSYLIEKKRPAQSSKRLEIAAEHGSTPLRNRKKAAAPCHLSKTGIAADKGRKQ